MCLNKKNISIVIILIPLLLLTMWALWIEPDSTTVKKRVVELSSWHKEQNGFKIAVLSDLHIGWPYINGKKVRKIIELTNAQKPDLIILLGDYTPANIIRETFPQIDRRKKTISIIKLLKNLQASLGKISILGNHDWGFDKNLIRKNLEESGIKVLENEVTNVYKNNETLHIAGIADLWNLKNTVLGTLSKINDKNPIILLSHNPDVFPEIPYRVSLTIAGHTHGGQINLPFIRPIITPSIYGDRYAVGYIIENGKRLFVSPGIGTTALPIRFLDPPEVTILEIYKADDKND